MWEGGGGEKWGELLSKPRICTGRSDVLSGTSGGGCSRENSRPSVLKGCVTVKSNPGVLPMGGKVTNQIWFGQSRSRERGSKA